MPDSSFQSVNSDLLQRTAYALHMSQRDNTAFAKSRRNVENRNGMVCATIEKLFRWFTSEVKYIEAGMFNFNSVPVSVSERVRL